VHDQLRLGRQAVQAVDLAAEQVRQAAPRARREQRRVRLACGAGAEGERGERALQLRQVRAGPGRQAGARVAQRVQQLLRAHQLHKLLRGAGPLPVRGPATRSLWPPPVLHNLLRGAGARPHCHGSRRSCATGARAPREARRDRQPLAAHQLRERLAWGRASCPATAEQVH